jgi:hypothetical protein
MVQCVPKGKIYLKFYTGNLHENNSRRSKFGENLTDVWDISHKELISFVFSDNFHLHKGHHFNLSGISLVMIAEDV